MFILQVLVILIGIMIYVYTGLRLVETIKDETMYIYFWLAYIFFGITLFNIVIISKYWGKLSTKTAPPGPRGPRGDDGKIGPSGTCNMDSNLVYAQKEIKETIARTVKSQYNDLAIDDIYEEETLRLKNNYLDYKIKLILTSKQFETVLLTPSDDNNPNKKADETKVYGKSIEDLSGYLANTWREWIIGIINTDKNNARTLFITNDAQIDISPEIENYFNTEIMKYDVWYWGSTRVFRPLQAEICRSEYVDDNGKAYPNSRYPMNNRPKLEIMELEFTRSEIGKYCTQILDFNLTSTLNDNNDNEVKYDVEFKNKYDILSRYKNPVFYLPDVKTTSVGQKFYPIGCIIVERNAEDNNKIKTVLVSGDIVIPNSYKELWNNSVKINDTFKCNYEYKRKRGLRRTEHKKRSKNTNEQYDRFLSDNLINENANYSLDNDSKDNRQLNENKGDEKALIEFNTDVSEYVILGDLPTIVEYKDVYENSVLQFKRYFKILDMIRFINGDEEKTRKNYKGIVAVPKAFLNEVSGYDMEWSFRHKELLKKTFKLNDHKDIPKPPGSSKYNKNYKTTFKQLDRKIVDSKKVDLLCDSKYSIMKVKTNDKLPTFYDFKSEILKPTVYSIKDFDKKYEDLGFGWFGYPMKKYRKYSIFAYLGLMPEGIIVHRASGRKFYIKHYGGVEPNKFIVYMWSEKKKDFTNCVTVRNNTQCFIGIAKKTDPRCQFKVVIDKEVSNYFRLEPIEYPKKYLRFDFDVNENANLQKNSKNTGDTSLKTKRPRGINMDHTETYISLSSYGKLEPNNPVIFFNQPATGTNMQILNERMPRNIDRSKSTTEQYNQQKILNTTDRNSFNYLYKYNEPVEIDTKYNLHPKSELKYSK
jgi:hypothetical protein